MLADQNKVPVPTTEDGAILATILGYVELSVSYPHSTSAPNCTDVSQEKVRKITMRSIVMAVFLTMCLTSSAALVAQTKTPSPPPAKTAAPTAEELNTQEYITLLRKDVSGEKAKLLGTVMQFDAEDAAKFWPIYRDYQAELNKLNDLRVANIQEYARTYTQMTDEKADELIKNAMAYQKQRSELLAKYYERVKQELGAITAARFVYVEHQLLTIIDLKVASALPVVGS
jgi:hypothetical protein